MVPAFLEILLNYTAKRCLLDPSMATKISKSEPSMIKKYPCLPQVWLKRYKLLSLFLPIDKEHGN